MLSKILTILGSFFKLLGHFSDWKKKKEVEKSFNKEQELEALKQKDKANTAKIDAINDYTFSHLLPKKERDIYKRLFYIQSDLFKRRGNNDSFTIKDFDFASLECEQCDLGVALFKERLDKCKRNIDKIVIHCSDSDYPHHDNVETIRQWHLARNFYDIGYHFVGLKDGSLSLGRDIELIPAAQKGHNENSVAYLLTGKDYFSNEQLLLAYHCIQYCLERKKPLEIYGHTDINPHKTCPNFLVKHLI